LLVQTISGEIRLDLPRGSGADIVADSKTGTVSSSFAQAVVNRTSRPQLQARLGNGGKGVRLFSQAGNITLANGNGELPGSAGKSTQTTVERSQPLEPAEVPTPKQRPELVGPEKDRRAAGTPAPASTGPEEISEGDVIRVDTELVSVNVPDP
jgi:hypothetical protein